MGASMASTFWLTAFSGAGKKDKEFIDAGGGYGTHASMMEALCAPLLDSGSVDFILNYLLETTRLDA